MLYSFCHPVLVCTQLCNIWYQFLFPLAYHVYLDGLPIAGWFLPLTEPFLLRIQFCAVSRIDLTPSALVDVGVSTGGR